jgi:dephospho-CoA kinase
MEEKAAVADWVLNNDGTEAELEAQVDDLWAHLTSHAAGA